MKRQEPGDTGPQEIRVCINYRARNETTYGDATACPEVLSTLQALSGSQYFGSADGKSAFHQIAMAHESKGFTAFQIRGKGSFEFRRMPFGLKTAPATFIKAMEIILAGALRLHPFIDDIKHGAPDFEGHLDDIRDLCTRCLVHNLRLSPKKFMAAFSRLNALGYVVDKEGLHSDPQKVEVIHAILQPKDATELRSFLGMVGYYSSLIPNYSQLSGPLFSLTTKGKNVPAEWQPEHTEAFNGLKGALAAQPSLAYPDHTKRYTVTCDWQPGHMAAILSQPHSVEGQEEASGTIQEVERPVHFIARKLSGYEAGWQATTGEQACVVWAVRKFHCYLYGVEFTLITDHKALVSMLHCQDTTGKLARWNVDLYPYDFRVQYRPGSQLCNADGLSRTDKEIRAEAPDPALISTVAPIFIKASDSREDEVGFDERKRWVDQYVKVPPPPSVRADVWEDFILDFRPYENLQSPLSILPTVRWQQELAPDLLRIMSKASPSYKAAMLEEEVLTDRYSLHTLEYLLSKERRHLLETKEPLQHELLLNRPALFWKDVYQELQHLQPQAQVLLAHIRQFLDTWESIHFWSGEPLDQRYWDAGFVHEAMGRPAVLTVKPYDQETPYSSSEESEEEEVLDINTPVTIPVDHGLESKYARLLKDPLTISPEEWKEMGKYMAAIEPSPADPWILEEAEESVDSSAAVDNSNGSLPELSTGATFMMRAVEYEEEAADSPHSAGPAADFDEDETEGFDEWISSLDAQINEDSLPGEEGEGLDDSDDSLVFLEERFEEDNVWLEEHLDVDESVKDAHFNVGPCIKYLTEEHAKAMKGATDPWSNPVLLSYLRFDRLPINISRTQRHLLLKRSKAFEWRTQTSDPGEHLIILRKGHPARLYPSPAYRRELLYKAHEEGHQQSFGMIRRLVKDYSWYRLREEAMEYVRRCHTCQDSSTMVTADREMHAIPVLDKGERWHLDLIGPLVEGIEGFKYAAVAIDSCTKWPEVAPLRTKRAEEVESFVFREIVCRFNVKEIVVDNGSEFLGDFEKMASDLGIKLVHTSVYHPQANGAVERYNQTLKRGLQRLSKDHPECWPALIPRVLRNYRATPQTSTGMAPSKFLYGKDLPLLGMEALAWMPYVDPEMLHTALPQGVEWVGQWVEKLFYHQQSHSLKLYQGKVESWTRTDMGQERLKILYSDGDSETQEVGNVLPRWMISLGRTWIESHSTIEPQDMPRVDHVLFSLLVQPPGNLLNYGLTLIKCNASFNWYKTALPAKRVRPGPFLRESAYPHEVVQPSPEDLEQTRLTLEDHAGMETLHDQGKANITRAQAKQVKGYAQRKKPRNRRAEAFEVGGHCRIRKKGPTARTRGGLQPWSTDLWKVERITDHVVTVRSVENSGVHMDVGRDDVLPVIAPSTTRAPEEIATPFEGDPVGGPSACGE